MTAQMDARMPLLDGVAAERRRDVVGRNDGQGALAMDFQNVGQVLRFLVGKMAGDLAIRR